jgi:cytochrome c biogenesis protein CcdA
MFLLLLSFIAGILTVLAPCILSLLPVIVGGSLQGKPNTRRAVTVAGALGASVIIFTLLLKTTTTFIAIPDTVWKTISGGIIIALGVIIIFPKVWDNIKGLNLLNRKSNQLLSVGYNKNTFLGDIITGAALGPVFSSCSPTYFFILATVLPENPMIGFIYLLTYAVGMSGALLTITFASRHLLTRLGIASNPHGWFKRGLGLTFVIVGILVITGVDRVIQTKILEMEILNIGKIERQLLETQQPE